MLTSAGFNRRMRKTACPVVWKGCGVKLPSAPSNLEGRAFKMILLSMILPYSR
jgi:hypothetical protein